MLIYYRFSDNSVLKITFSVQINSFMPVKLCYIWHFFVDSPKEIETKYVFLQQTVYHKVPKGRIYFASLSRWLLCVDTTLVNLLN